MLNFPPTRPIKAPPWYKPSAPAGAPAPAEAGAKALILHHNIVGSLNDIVANFLSMIDLPSQLSTKTHRVRKSRLLLARQGGSRWTHKRLRIALERALALRPPKNTLQFPQRET